MINRSLLLSPCSGCTGLVSILAEVICRGWSYWVSPQLYSLFHYIKVGNDVTSCLYCNIWICQGDWCPIFFLLMWEYTIGHEYERASLLLRKDPWSKTPRAPWCCKSTMWPIHYSLHSCTSDILNGLCFYHCEINFGIFLSCIGICTSPFGLWEVFSFGQVSILTFLVSRLEYMTQI